jgi:predicted RNA binding protein YcfA (HicA-like mRNA interferase family)
MIRISSDASGSRRVALCLTAVDDASTDRAGLRTRCSAPYRGSLLLCSEGAGRTLGAMKVRDLVRYLAADGWVLVRTRGSHRQFKHPIKTGLVTIAGSGNDDLAPGTLNSILKQARLKTPEAE